jgi:hypothetical protein
MRTREKEPGETSVAESDEWGRDPSVRAMRRVFGAMEEAQKHFLTALELSPFDYRLRRWRERALAAFEASWARGARAGVELGETEAGTLYVRCLGKIMAGEGIKVLPGNLPENEKLEEILREVLP